MLFYLHLKSNYIDLELVILKEDDYPRSFDLIIVTSEFENMHPVLISKICLQKLKEALQEDFYAGIYSFIGMSKIKYQNEYGDRLGRTYIPHRQESSIKIGAKANYVEL